MGKVWVARHKGLETEVVVKFLAASSDPEDAATRFASEAAAAAAVKSPHVVQMFDHGITPDGLRYIVMELLEGRDLAKHLAEHGPMAPRDVALMVAQIAKALSKAHQAGVIHRDIKPENIFLCDGDVGEMFVKVLDFGIAKREQQATSKTTTGMVIGTPFYMSPEQILGERPVDARTDIWSLGVVTFEALTGKRPFDGATVGALTLSIHHAKPPPPSAIARSVPAPMDEWFARACARTPEDRFTTAREAGQAILVAAGDVSAVSGAFRPTMTSLVDLGETSFVASAPTTPTTDPSMTATSPSSPLPDHRRHTKWLMFGGGGVAAVVLGTLVGVALLGPTSTSRTTHAPPTEPAGIPSITDAPASAASPLPAIALPTTPRAASSLADSAPPPRAVPTASPEATGKRATGAVPGARPGAGKASQRSVRRSNDDDIK
ncbi:MAG: Serine/threonine protein kinase [Labilithrix sp.]|nr:Serine/threonine protein kinase [Labilithrix sp.]